ncbi:hypothetical protein Q3G72_004487 [Acer saccharum]|nr:hypothetical protein Q3G72_004487 [Acer saccharum]
MISTYVSNNGEMEALVLFPKMRRNRVQEDSSTFASILSAFSALGKFEFCEQLHGQIEHYSCMVDLFARAGCLEEAVNLIEEMPFQVDSSLWSSILRGCTVHGDKNLGKKVAKQITELDPVNSGAYVQLSNIFTTSREWERSSSVRKAMRDKQVKKNPGCSWG